ncbi:FAS1 domain-containing protein [Sphaerosporella brunnea]|uniref:FAS1 domain-containing protein n=1 Tax=Sphaerosporella brunnea TaxID=1250544 RepID=A0A5J5FCG4_9PEZI|nr:FAS1 domain-containing protein [Sphaerosporella brunnea]
MMHIKFISLLSLASLAVGQTVPDILTLLNGTSSLSQLAKAITNAPEVAIALGGAENITILAPNDEAFKAFSQMEQIVDGEMFAPLLTYHVLNGIYESTAFSKTPKFLPSILGDYQPFRNLSGAPQVVKAVLTASNNATVFGGLGVSASVVTANVKFTGGVVHIIDSLLPPPMNISTTAQIVQLTSLVGALTKADLVDIVDRLAGVTVFAPTNAAFQAVGNLVSDLTPQQLGDVLAYHVVPQVAYSTSLKDGMELTALDGKKLTITIKGDAVFVNGARVTGKDVLVNAGVVHVIDSVLNPNNTNDKPEVSASTQSPAFPSATRSPDEPFTSGIDASSTTTGASPSATGGVSKMGVSTFLVLAGAGVFAFGMMA